MTQQTKAMSGSISWVDLSTPNLEQAKKFYGDLFGWSYTGGDDPDLGFYSTAEIAGRRVAGIGPTQPGSSAPPTWGVYFASEDLDETTQKITQNGGTSVMPIMEIKEQGRMGLFQDPTGAFFGVWEGKKHQGAELIEEPGSMTWNEVYTRDVQRARDFYARVFSLEPEKLQDTNLEYWTLHKGPKAICGVMEMTSAVPKGEQPRWHTYFEAVDVDAAAKKIAELGGKVISPAFDTPWGRMLTAVDPFGASFSVVTSAKPAAAR